jgi:hypothetical protein
MREDVRNQTEAWETYDSFLQDERVSFRIEADPEPVESVLRKLTSNNSSLSQQWRDAYLAAFARAARWSPSTADYARWRRAIPCYSISRERRQPKARSPNLNPELGYTHLSNT